MSWRWMEEDRRYTSVLGFCRGAAESSLPIQYPIQVRTAPAFRKTQHPRKAAKLEGCEQRTLGGIIITGTGKGRESCSLEQHDIHANCGHTKKIQPAH